jgi:hypothetical protein
MTSDGQNSIAVIVLYNFEINCTVMVRIGSINYSILGYKVRKCIMTESRKSLKNRDEVEIFQLPRFCYGTF